MDSHRREPPSKLKLSDEEPDVMAAYTKTAPVCCGTVNLVISQKVSRFLRTASVHPMRGIGVGEVGLRPPTPGGRPFQAAQLSPASPSGAFSCGPRHRNQRLGSAFGRWLAADASRVSL